MPPATRRDWIIESKRESSPVKWFKAVIGRGGLRSNTCLTCFKFRFVSSPLSDPAMIRTAVFTMLVSRGVGRVAWLPRRLSEFLAEPPAGLPSWSAMVWVGPPLSASPAGSRPMVPGASTWLVPIGIVVEVRKLHVLSSAML